MKKTPLPDSVRRWLPPALLSWQKEGLITHDQASGILSLYEDEGEVSQRQQSTVSFALLGMGAFLIGLAVLLLIGFNWEYLTRSAKLVTVLTVVAATHGLGFWLRGKYRMLSEIVFFLGCLFYGAGIWLIAQAFHLDAHYPDGVWWWALGVLPFALCLDSILLHMLFVALMGTWAGMEVLGFMHHIPWWMFGYQVIPNGAYALPVMALPGLVWAYRKGSPTTVGLYVALFAWWVILQSFAWRFGLSPLAVFWVCGVGALLLLIAEVHRVGDPMAIPYRLWGTVLAAGSLVVMSSWWFWQGVSRMRLWGGPDLALSLRLVTPGVAFALLALGAGLVLVRFRSPDTHWRQRLMPNALLILSALLAFWTIVIPDELSASILPALLANVAMLGLAIYLINVGAREERVRPFGAGVLYFLIWAIARYCDLFAGAGGMLAAAAIFALCGVALFVIARFWGQVRHSKPEAEPAPAVQPWQAPAWIARPADWVRDHVRLVLWTAAALHLVILGGMIAIESAPLLMGQTILLRVAPVDPRDFFRGDYVILSYDINRVAPPAGAYDPSNYGRPVYVTIEPEADGKHWRGVKASFERPTTGKFLVGKMGRQWGNQVEFGIEAYFVQEGKGLEWEDRLRNRQKVSAEVVVSPWGKAKLKRLVAEE